MKSVVSTCLAIAALFVVALPSSAQLAQQSPINISKEATVKANLPKLSFSYAEKANITVKNTGAPDIEATVKAFVLPGAGSVTVSGTTYNLLQFHFHTPSEHAVDGEETPMEVHFVHADSNGNLLVVGRRIEFGEKNEVLAPIFSKLPTIATPLVLNKFNIKDLIPETTTSYRYAGSLTTAPYTEGVKWVVLSEPMTFSSKQVAAFQRLFPLNNSRELQLLNGRCILSDVRKAKKD
jgi:carbonic anhydrase